ncbi:hypothetical protein RI129_007180 [Pyrocoelia pectoralis]|uniref:4-coumarate--CoA ligase n=1 Tax=Pyrocoelia pectoralis TaxID=417401 RepID=A0AAN7V7J9_9COLE
MFGLTRYLKPLTKLYPTFSVTLKQKLHSIVPSITIPNLHLDECIWQNLEKWHDKTALVCAETNRSYTYLELYRKTNALSNFLYKFEKLKQADTVAIILPNLPEYAIILLGIIQAGCKVTTLNPLYTPDEMAKHLLQSDTKLIFTSNEVHHSVQRALELIKLEVPLVLLETTKGAPFPTGVINFDNIIQKPCDFKLNLVRNPEDTMLRIFSSGTTGLPKIIELTNKNLVSNLYQISTPDIDPISEANGSEREVVPILLPMYHIYGLVVVLLHGLFKGCKLVTIQRFKSQPFINLMLEHKPTVLYLVPPIARLLISNNDIKSHHFDTTKSIISSAAPLGSKDVIALQNKLGGKTDIMQTYGLTELGMCLTQSSHITNGIKPDGVGFLLPSTEGKIISIDTGNEVGVNQKGELLIRGPQVLKGYYKNDDANKEIFTNDGWFKTGDLGYYDEDGHFFIADRLKHYIKVSGYQVSPVEIEEIIRHHPDVKDTAVIGVSHSRFGEAPKAFVVRKPYSRITSFAIQEFVKRKVVNYKQLNGGVCFVDSIPKSPSGKVFKNELKKL